MRDLASRLKTYKENIQSVVFDGVITQRLVDIASSNAIKNLVGVKIGNIAKVPADMEVLTASMFVLLCLPECKGLSCTFSLIFLLLLVFLKPKCSQLHGLFLELLRKRMVFFRRKGNGIFLYIINLDYLLQLIFHLSVIVCLKP